MAIFFLILKYFWGVNDLVLHLILNKQQAFQVIHLLMANSCRLVDVFLGRMSLLADIVIRVLFFKVGEGCVCGFFYAWLVSWVTTL
jgi:hypothetical protein